MRTAMFRVMAFSTFLTLAITGALWAHPQISPEEVPAGATEEFVLEVVHVKDEPTTEVRMEVPEGFVLSSVRSPTGWQGIVEEDAVIWQGMAVGPNQGEKKLGFEAKVPDDTDVFAFKIVQIYVTGRVVEWTGAEDSDQPAAIVSVTSGGLHGGRAEGHEDGEDGHAGEELSGTGGTEPTLLPLSVFAAVILALGVALIARLRRS
jgi:uncharacterized protein YcnI